MSIPTTPPVQSGVSCSCPAQGTGAKKFKLPKIDSPGPDISKREMAELAATKKFDFELVPKSQINEWMTIKVTDGKKRTFNIEIFDALYSKKTCTCNQFFQEESGWCQHLAAFEGLEKFGWNEAQQDVILFKQAIARDRVKIPITTRLYRQGALCWDPLTQDRVVHGKVPVVTENWKAYCLWKQNQVTVKTKVPQSFSSVGILENNLNLFDYQETVFEKMLNAKRAICSMSLGSGKAQPLTSKILTPTGWKLMGDIKVGDQVIGKTGNPTNVIGVFPQGVKDVYKVTFSDGSSTECCNEHLWSVLTVSRKRRGLTSQTFSLGEIKNNLSYKGHLKYQIPMVESVRFSPQNIEIDPYFLGLLLGDGCLDKKTVSISTTDEEIVGYVSKIIDSTLKIRKSKKCDYNFSKKIISKEPNKLLNIIRSLNLSGKHSFEKFIPKQFIYNSIDVRLAILQGLMDTDGFVDKKGVSVIYYTTSKQLSKDVQEIVHSLGGKAVIVNRQTSYTHKEVKRLGRLSFAVHISMPGDMCPFRLKRKVERFKPKTKYPPIRSFAKVELIGQAYTQCISVDAPDHLYVTDDYVVTHNTLTTMTCYGHLKMQKENATLLVVAPKSLCLQWVGELKRGLKLNATWIDKPEKMSKLKTEAGPFIVTYQYATKFIDELKKHTFDMVIVDEIQFVKNGSTKTWKGLSQIKSEYFYGLSGTVIENRLDDLYSIMQIVNPASVGPLWKFNLKFQEISIVSKVKIVFTGVKNLDKLKEQLKDYIFFYDNVKLPSITHERIIVDMNSVQKGLHDFSMGEAEKLMAKSLTQPLTFGEKAMVQAYYLKARQAAQGVELCTKTAPTAESPLSNKMIEFEKLLKEVCLVKKEKIVVFSEWTEHLKIAQRVADSLGLKNVFFTGDESAKKRNDNVNLYKTDPNIQVFFSSDAGGVGLDGLQLVANNVVHLELPWNPSRLDQRTGRVHRYLQTKDVTAYYIICKGSIEDQIENRLTEKRDTRNQTLRQFG